MKTLFRTFPIKIQPRQLATEIKRNHTIIPPSLSLSFSPLTLEHALVKELLTSVQKFRDKFKIGTEFPPPPLYLSKPQKEKKKERRIADKLESSRGFLFLFRPITLCTNPIVSYRSLSRRKFIQRGEGEKISGRYDISFYFPTNLYSPPLISIQIPSSLPLEIGGYLDSHFLLYPLYRRFTVSVGKYWIEKGEDWSHFLDISAEIAREWIQDERIEQRKFGDDL